MVRVYSGDQFYWWMKSEFPGKTTDLSTYDMYHLQSFETHKFFEGIFFYNRHVVIIHDSVDVKKNMKT